MKHKKIVLAILLWLILIVFLVEFSGATTVSVTVPAGEVVNRKMDLVVDDRVKIQFNVVGTKTNLISFSLVCPNGTEISFGEIGVFSHSFVCDAKGEYTMVFVNVDMTDSKLVTLNYEVEHYLFGMSQTLFLVLVITVLCVGMVAAYVLLSPSM